MADLVHRMRRYQRFKRVERVFRDRSNPLEILTGEEVRDRYRFYPETILLFLDRIFHLIDHPTRRSLPLPPLLTLLVTLHFYASGAHYVIIGDIHGISKATVSRAVRRGTSAICLLLQEIVKMPSAGEETVRVQREFFNVARFPKVIGAIDCTQIPIQGPSQNEGDYVNRKGFHSINVQVVCDATFMIRNIVAKWPGSVHDSRIFRESQLFQLFDQGHTDGILLGDSGYPCRPYIMTPYLNPANPAQQRYNDALCKTRVIIEQTFGVLKRRFACLSYGLRASPESACKIITACAVLHNYGLVHGDALTRYSNIELEPPEVMIDPTAAGARERDLIAATYF